MTDQVDPARENASPQTPEVRVSPPTGSATAAPEAAGGAVGWERAALEKLAFASLHEQTLARRWRTFVRLAWLSFFVFLTWAVLSRGDAASGVSVPHTAVVEIKGEIASDTEASAELLVAALRGAFEDDGAQAVVILINSPGGSPVQAGIVNDEIKRLKAKQIGRASCRERV